MQPASSFILLLGSLFVIVLDAYAIPLTHGKKGVVTLSLKRTPMRRDLHPHIVSTTHLQLQLKVGSPSSNQPNSSSKSTSTALIDALPT